MRRRKKSDEISLALIQMTSSPDPDENVLKAVSRIRQSAGKGAQIVCLGELFRSRYFCQSEDARNFKLAEPVPGPTTDALQNNLRELEIVIVASIFETR